MALSNELLSLFAKTTKDDNSDKKKTSTVYGTVTSSGDQKFVKIDGSEETTPAYSTVDVKDGDRVIVMIKDHSATITGNLNDPSASSKKVGDINDITTYVDARITNNTNKITELGIAVADRVTTEVFYTDIANVRDEMVAKDVIVKNELQAAIVEVDEKLTAKDVEITGKIEANEADITNLKTNKLDIEAAAATYATIVNLQSTNTEVNNLKATHADFKNATADHLEAVDASIYELNTKKLDAESAKITYANIDFSNIGHAAMEYFYANSGLIENVIINSGSITGVLIGVTIKGDIIEGGTIVADKLVIQGEDGLYYKLNTDGVHTEAEQTAYNSLDGGVITAKSITATKINVDDLVAFDATIGGFNVTSDAIYSGAKESIDNSTQGIYMDREGQISLGDGDNYIRYYRTEDGNWKLEISAESILFGGGSKSSAEDIKNLTEHVKIGTYKDPETSDEQPCVELSEGDSDFKQVITNTSTMFMDGSMVRTKMDADGVTTENATVKDEFRHGGFVWKNRSNGNLGLIWKGGNS